MYRKGCVKSRPDPVSQPAMTVLRKHVEDDRDEGEDDNSREEVAREVKWPIAIFCNKDSVVSNKYISNQNPWQSFHVKLL